MKAICRGFVAISVLLLTGCGTPDERDFNKIRDSADRFAKDSVLESVEAHIREYPGCEHRKIFEEYFFQSCQESRPVCQRYLKLFASGYRTHDIEELLWSDCEKGRCENYIAAYPQGEHIAAARRRLQEQERQQAIEHQLRVERLDREIRLDSERRDQLWSGPKIEAEFLLPYEADRKQMKVMVEGETIFPIGERYTVPVKASRFAVCYGNEQQDSRFSDSNCGSMELKSGFNLVPLSRLRILGPERYKLDCKLDYGWRFTPDLKDRIFLMPGSHTVSCNLDAGAHADFASETIVYDEFFDVKVPFEAPSFPGTVIVYYTVNPGRAYGEARTSTEQF